MSTKKTYLSLKDYSVSGEEFQLLYDTEYDLLETDPKPEAAELESYYESEDYISHTDSKRNMLEKVYHLVRKHALKTKLKLINQQASSGKKLLDIGCGTGDFLLTAKQANWNTYGIEPNDQAREIALEKVKDQIYGTEQLLNFEDGSFDVITLWHVLEHLPDTKKELAIYERLLKSDGTLIIAVPNFKSYDASYYKNFWAAFDVPRHLWHFSKKSMQMLSKEQGMEVIEILPMKFDSFYVSLLSEKYISGRSNLFKAGYIGLLSNLRAFKSKEYSSLIYVIKKA